MTTDIRALFESEKGRKIYKCALDFIKEHNLSPDIKRGVLVGFSGGPDSVMLLSVLKKYSEDFDNFKLLAVHINHGIRADEAMRDEDFSREFAESIGVEFIAKFYDIPSLSNELSRGIEETARYVRYSAFNEIIQGRNDIKTIAVAHNATDNLETVIFNLTRGAGTHGMSGIQPKRDNIIRPLLSVAKCDVVSALTEAKIPFVIDSTNSVTEYTRNYIRSEILPRLVRLNAKPEAMVTRMAKNLRSDDDFISGLASEFLKRYSPKIPQKEFAALHPALFGRVVQRLQKEVSGVSLENVHINEIYELLKIPKNRFSISLPGNVSFVADGEFCEVLQRQKKEKPAFCKTLIRGVNKIPEINAEIILSDEKIDDSSVKIYKTAIQASIYSDIIEGELFVRERRDGDSYVFGKMTRKLKKLFNDKGLSLSEREHTPIICDEKGILWLPGFSVRDGDVSDKNKKLYLLVGYKE